MTWIDSDDLENWAQRDSEVSGPGGWFAAVLSLVRVWQAPGRAVTVAAAGVLRLADTVITDSDAQAGPHRDWHAASVIVVLITVTSFLKVDDR